MATKAQISKQKQEQFIFEYELLCQRFGLFIGKDDIHLVAHSNFKGHIKKLKSFIR